MTDQLIEPGMTFQDSLDPSLTWVVGEAHTPVLEPDEKSFPCHFVLNPWINLNVCIADEALVHYLKSEK